MQPWVENLSFCCTFALYSCTTDIILNMVSKKFQVLIILTNLVSLPRFSSCYLLEEAPGTFSSHHQTFVVRICDVRKKKYNHTLAATTELRNIHRSVSYFHHNQAASLKVKYGTSILLDALTGLRNAGHFLRGTGVRYICRESGLLSSWLGLSSELPICSFVQSNHWWWVCCSCCSHWFNALTVNSLCVKLIFASF